MMMALVLQSQSARKWLTAVSKFNAKCECFEGWFSLATDSESEFVVGVVRALPT